MSFLLTLAAFAVAIGVLVTVHEYGHYWVARRFSVKILTFSIGFGAPLKVWQRGETQWQIAAIPLGGYVKMLDEREAPVLPEERDRAFNRQSIWRRMAIVAAGPAANLVLAVLIYIAIFMSGVEITRPVIGTVYPDSMAARAGFVAGDAVVSVDGDHVDSWADVRLALVDAAAANRLITIGVRHPVGDVSNTSLDFVGFDPSKVDGDVAEHIGLSLAVYLPRFGPLLPDGAAQRAGFQTGDVPVAVDGVPTRDWPTFAAAIKARPGISTKIEVRRDDRMMTLSVVPKPELVDGVTVGRIGAMAALDEAAMRRLITFHRYGPFDAIRLAANQTWQTSALSVRMMWRMLTGHVSVKQLSGPVAIADYAGQSAKLGLRAYLEFLCMISISLGVLNLLPIPVLDGGHLLYYSAELLRGRPLSERAMELGQRLGVGLLAALMAVALFNDITRLVGS
jgi:regulator of sigma E protease